MSKMKILQVIQKPQLRGAEIFACQLSVELKNIGHEVDVLFLFGSKAEILPFPLYFLHLEANIKKRFWDFSAYKKLNSIIVAGQYDIIQANAADTLKYTVLSKLIYLWKAKLVYRNANKISDFLNSFPKRIVNSLLMNKVDSVASVSSECRDDFISIYSSFRNKIESLPIGVSLHNPKPYSSLSKIGIEGNGPFLLHVAGFVPEKNHAGLLRIFSNLIITYPTAKLLLIGEGKLKSDIEILAREMQLAQNIYFLGKRNDVLKIMPCCDVFLLPSLIEGMPGVILEAFVSQLPVISYNVGGIKEIVINHQTGWLIDKNDEYAFVKALEACLSSDTEFIRKNSYSLVKQNYSNVLIALKFSKFYKKMLLP